MAGITPERQFRGTCRLVLHQLHRVGESFDVDECYAAALEKRMLHDDQVEFIKECFRINEQEVVDAGPGGLDLLATIKQLQYLVSSRMNLGDCA